MTLFYYIEHLQGHLYVRCKTGSKLYLGDQGTITNTYVLGGNIYTLYDSDLGKMILSNGTAWVNLDGTALA